MGLAPGGMGGRLRPGGIEKGGFPPSGASLDAVKNKVNFFG